MIFYKVDSPEPVAAAVAKTLREHLPQGKKVFWIVTGGTAIKVAVEVSKQLAGQNLDGLSVTLTDERYGPIGHDDSNWYHLEQAGFNLPGATMLPVLQGKDRQQSTRDYAATLADNFATADYSLGLFGIGPDGHTAGILPGSPNIDTNELATSYADSEATQEFTEGVYRDKDRITMTAVAITHLDEAIVVALGKDPSLFERLEQTIDVSEMPAQALKQVAALSVYNDYKGEKI